MLENRTKPEETRETIREGELAFRGRDTPIASCCRLTSTWPRTQEKKKKKTTSVPIERSRRRRSRYRSFSYRSPSRETGGSRRRSKFCRVRADSCKAPLLHLPSVHILRRRKEKSKGEREKERETGRRRRNKEREEEEAREASERVLRRPLDSNSGQRLYRMSTSVKTAENRRKKDAAASHDPRVFVERRLIDD